MSEIPLATKNSSKTYDQALSNLVKRWKQSGGEEPIKYNEAAIGMDRSTVSTCLKYFGEIGLLEVAKAGNYNVPEDVFNYRTKMGTVKTEAKQDVARRLMDYPLYKETEFMLGVNEFTLEELTKEVSGSATVAASQDELPDVERSLAILETLGFLVIDDEGRVSMPDELKDDIHSGEPGAGTTPEDEGEVADGGTVAAAPQEPESVTVAGAENATTLAIDLDITMDVTEMETEEIQEKLEGIHGALEQE